MDPGGIRAEGMQRDILEPFSPRVFARRQKGHSDREKGEKLGNASIGERRDIEALADG